MRELSPAFFEKLIIELLIAMGYGGGSAEMGQAIGRSGDGGIDGTIKEDALGLDIVYVQAKRYGAQNTVGSGEVQGFAGSLDGVRATKVSWSRPRPSAGRAGVRPADRQADRAG